MTRAICKQFAHDVALPIGAKRSSTLPTTCGAAHCDKTVRYCNDCEAWCTWTSADRWRQSHIGALAVTSRGKCEPDCVTHSYQTRDAPPANAAKRKSMHAGDVVGDAQPSRRCARLDQSQVGAAAQGPPGGMRFHVRPGDALYIPAGWWHAVMSKGESLSELDKAEDSDKRYCIAVATKIAPRASRSSNVLCLLAGIINEREGAVAATRRQIREKLLRFLEVGDQDAVTVLALFDASLDADADPDTDDDQRIDTNRLGMIPELLPSRTHKRGVERFARGWQLSGNSIGTAKKLVKKVFPSEWGPNNGENPGGCLDVTTRAEMSFGVRVMEESLRPLDAEAQIFIKTIVSACSREPATTAATSVYLHGHFTAPHQHAIPVINVQCFGEKYWCLWPPAAETTYERMKTLTHTGLFPDFKL